MWYFHQILNWAISLFDVTSSQTELELVLSCRVNQAYPDLRLCILKKPWSNMQNSARINSAPAAIALSCAIFGYWLLYQRWSQSVCIGAVLLRQWLRQCKQAICLLSIQGAMVKSRSGWCCCLVSSIISLPTYIRGHRERHHPISPHVFSFLRHI